MTSNVLDRPLLGVRSVAAKLAVSEKTVRRLIEAGQLPALRVGGQIRIDPGELEHWLFDSAPKTPADEATSGLPLEGDAA
jgi:excisionase family DNA binding protein